MAVLPPCLPVASFASLFRMDHHDHIHGHVTMILVLLLAWLLLIRLEYAHSPVLIQPILEAAHILRVVTLALALGKLQLLFHDTAWP